MGPLEIKGFLMTNPSLGDLIRRCHEQVAWFIQPVSLRSAEPPYRNLPEDAMFTALVVAAVMIILANRSWSRSAFSMLGQRNPALWWIVGGTAVFLALVLVLPQAQTLFHFATLEVDDLAFALGTGLAALVWCEGLKLGWRVIGRRGQRSSL